MDKPLWMWIGFFAVVAALLAIDLGGLHRKERDITIRESLWLSAGYVFVSLCFALVVTYYLGASAGKEFITGYLIEKSLSMDNILVIAMVFLHFQIPKLYQHRVLFWGVLGVVILRGMMVGLGATLIAHFYAVLYLFGAFLIFTGLRMFLIREKHKTFEENKLLHWLRGHVPTTATLHGKQFIAYEPNVMGVMLRKATPLLVTLLFIELADVIFAIDSVPAVFAITTDPFIVYTSNIFAILGLRALYFALAAMLHRFAYLKYALSLVLIFVGAKILLASYIVISSNCSLLITLLLLLGGVCMSLLKTQNAKHGA